MLVAVIDEQFSTVWPRVATMARAASTSPFWAKNGLPSMPWIWTETSSGPSIECPTPP